jgi:isopentenyl-diphosphate delta-isomerase type 1
MPYSTDNEILEIVDESDNVIGTATRAEIHRKRLRHRAVHIFVFNSAGKIYVQRRSSSKDRFPDRLDSSAAGHVDPGESYEETAIRELQEELGIRAEIEEILSVEASAITENEFVRLFEAHTDSAPVPDPDEIQWGEFMTRERLTKLMEEDPEDFVPAFILLWNQYIAEENNQR